MKTIADWQMQDALTEYSSLYKTVHGHEPSAAHMQDVKNYCGGSVGKMDIAIKILVADAERRQEQRAYLDEGDM